jgi:hypothetical protein
MHKVPEVRDLVGEYVLLQFDEASSGSVEAIVCIVDRIFDLCREAMSPAFEMPTPRPSTIEVQIIPWSLTELAAAKYLGRDMKELWAGMTADRREEIMITGKDWTARRRRMNPDQRLVDDRESFVGYDLLMELLANA